MKLSDAVRAVLFHATITCYYKTKSSDPPTRAPTLYLLLYTIQPGDVRLTRRMSCHAIMETKVTALLESMDGLVDDAPLVSFERTLTQSTAGPFDRPERSRARGQCGVIERMETTPADTGPSPGWNGQRREIE